MTRILKEPLLHFLCIGALIFVLYALVASKDIEPDAGNEIVLADEDLERLSQDWRRKWNRLPSSEELESLVDAWIRDEVYYREALAMGLDREDTVVRRRLIQKMEFLSNDLADRNNPEDADLRDYFQTNADAYRQPEQVSFQHIYLSRDLRGSKIQQDAENLLATLNSQPEIVRGSQTVGDPFMHPSHLEMQSPDKVARVFGNDFAARLFRVERGSWQGPIPSGYGLHLVRIEDKIAARLPELSTVIDDVRRDWMFAQRKQANEQVYQRLRSRYRIRDGQGGNISQVTTDDERSAS